MAYNYNNSTGKVPGDDPLSHKGWAFYGECLEYGTFVVASNGDVLFWPCGTNCGVGFEHVCPPPGGGMCRLNF